MPTYLYECEVEGRFEIFQSMKDDALTTCPDCDAPVKKIFLPPMLGAGTGGLGGKVKDSDFSRNLEARIEKDRPAFKALKDQGYMPGRMMGAHRLMTEAKTQLEIETGRVMPGTKGQIESLVNQLAEGGMNILKKDMKTGKRNETVKPISSEPAAIASDKVAS